MTDYRIQVADRFKGSAGTTLSSASPVEISNGHAFVFGSQGGGNMIQAIDLTNPAAPRLAGNLWVGESALDLSVDGDRAYFVEIHLSLRVIDVSNPMNLQVVAGSHYNMPAVAQCVVGRGGHAYMACDRFTGLRALDVSAPPALRLIGNAAIPFEIPSDMAADDRIVCVTVYNVGMYVFPVQCATTTNAGEPPAAAGALPQLLVGPNPAHGTVLLRLELQQAGAFWNWNIFRVWINPLMPVTFLIFFTCMLAETNRAPFDMAEAESELVAGAYTEYSSMGFGVFFMAEYANIVVGCAIATALFLGGWGSPIASR